MRLIDVPMCENDIGAFTVGEFLKMLLITLWEETDSFSGKRPFGNSDWQYQVYASLINAGYEIGSLDEYGDVQDVNYTKADRLIKDAIKEVFEDEPVKHGRWAHDGDGDWYCTLCKEYHTFDEYGDIHPKDDCGYYYCPNCGAKMDLEDNA